MRKSYFAAWFYLALMLSWFAQANEEKDQAYLYDIDAPLPCGVLLEGFIKNSQPHRQLLLEEVYHSFPDSTLPQRILIWTIEQCTETSSQATDLKREIRRLNRAQTMFLILFCDYACVDIGIMNFLFQQSGSKILAQELRQLFADMHSFLEADYFLSPEKWQESWSNALHNIKERYRELPTSEWALITGTVTVVAVLVSPIGLIVVPSYALARKIYYDALLEKYGQGVDEIIQWCQKQASNDARFIEFKTEEILSRWNETHPNPFSSLKSIIELKGRFETLLPQVAYHQALLSDKYR